MEPGANRPEAVKRGDAERGGVVGVAAAADCLPGNVDAFRFTRRFNLLHQRLRRVARGHRRFVINPRQRGGHAV